MLFVAEIAMIVLGFIALVGGKFPLTKDRVVRGTPARMLGILAILPLPVSFAAGLAIGIAAAMTGHAIDMSDFSTRLALGGLELLVFLGFLGLIYGIGWRQAVPPEVEEFPPGDDPDFAPPARSLSPRPSAKPAPRGTDLDLAFDQPETSGKATASLVLGISSLFLSLFTAIPAIWVGILGLMDIKKSQGRLRGTGMAIAGLILGSLSTLGGLLLIVAVTMVLRAGLGEPGDRQPPAQVATNPANGPDAARKAAPRRMPDLGANDASPTDAQPQPFGDGAPAKAALRSARPEPRKPAATSTLAVSPEGVNAPLKAKRTRVDDLDVTKLDGAGKDVIPSLVWSGDGKSFYCLSKNAGVLRKVTLDGLVEDLRLEIGRPAAWLSTSSLGLLVALPNLQEVWVVDPSSLEVVKKIVSPGVTRVASSPASSLAFATSQKPRAGGANEVDILDLNAGLSLGQVKASSLGNQAGFGFANLSPDGTHLYALGNGEQIVSYRYEDGSLTLEAAGPRIGQNPQDLVLSPDGKWLALPSGGGNYVPDASHPPQNYGTYLYDPGDLAKPVSVIESGPYPRVLGFDVKNDLVYAQNHEYDLITFQSGGTRLKAYKTATGEPSRFLPHPDNGKLLVVNSRGDLFEIEPATGPAPTEEPAKKKMAPAKKPSPPRSKAKKNDNP